MQTQVMTVQMSRQCLEEGGGLCDWNITGAVNQHLNTYEVKDNYDKSNAQNNTDCPTVYNILLLKHSIEQWLIPCPKGPFSSRILETGTWKFWPWPLFTYSAASHPSAHSRSKYDNAKWTKSPSKRRNPETTTLFTTQSCQEILFMKTINRISIKSAKDICMWVSWVARLGYCSIHGLRSATIWTLSSPYRPWSMTCGGILSGNLLPRTGWPPWHQHPFFAHPGGLSKQTEWITLCRQQRAYSMPCPAVCCYSTDPWWQSLFWLHISNFWCESKTELIHTKK